MTRELSWRDPIPSLNYLLTSHVWRQRHNGFSHQDPGFIDHVVNTKGEVVRVYLLPDANTLLSVTDHCLRSHDYVNVIVAGKQPAPSWLDMDDAILHCTRGVGTWEWPATTAVSPMSSSPAPGTCPLWRLWQRPTCSAGTCPSCASGWSTLSTSCACPTIGSTRTGCPDAEYDAIFTTDRPIVFAYHGYPWLIHRLTYRRHGHDNLHVRGHKEEGTTTTPFDMVVRNDMDRFHLVMDVIDYVPGLAQRAAGLRQLMVDKRTEHHDYIRRTGEDLPEVRDWAWPGRVRSAR